VPGISTLEMKITVTGATGLIGRRLVERLKEAGDEVTVLSRGRERAAAELGVDAVAWDPAAGPAPAEALRGRDGVVHLAGEPVAQRWSSDVKRRIRSSREVGTNNLVEGMRGASPRPGVLVSASGVDYYGARGDEDVTEDDPPADDFLAQVCVAWEGEAQRAEELGVRVARLRTGVVLSAQGGALAKMLPPFKLGLGVVLGDGAAPLSWITLDDVVAALRFAIDRQELAGPVNLTAPEPTTQRGLAIALGRALHRPVLFRMPGALLRLAVGELADSLLGAAAVLPTQLIRHQFRFAFPSLTRALDHVLGVSSAGEARSSINDDGGDRLQQ
jgi:uncharacterized protein